MVVIYIYPHRNLSQDYTSDGKNYNKVFLMKELNRLCQITNTL